jgi:ankyrin repeat protein
MRLLNSSFEFREFDYDDTPPPYAILSHTWSENNEEEVTYQDLKDGTTKSKLKLELCRDWANAAGYEYFWIDTCCINKQKDAELVYAIRSMWRWYEKAAVCFVYLPDLSKKRKRDTDADWRDGLKDCRWFTRGWTLQELVASKKVEFYAADGYLGSSEDLLPALKSITGINLGDPLPNHATRLSWVEKRITKRPEDKAYCMIGICDVRLRAEYGEGGDAAWQRLQDAITRRHGTIAQEAHGAAAATRKDHRAKVLEALRFDGLETRRRTVKVALAKTCEWILDHPACANWMKLKHKFFWIKGKPGAGKSVLVKYLDQHITQRLRKSHAIGLYFYFNARGERLEKSFLGLYRSLLVQLVDLVPKLVHELNALDTRFDLLELQSVLTTAILGLDRQIWLFIDALDECREGDVQELIEFLEGLQEAQLYVCFASRHYPVIKVPPNLQLVLEEVDEHKQDLSTYIEKLDLEGKELAQMQRDIVAKANGIFLWVVLVVKILQKDVQRARFHAMQSRLREIPEGLPELFKTIILRDNEHKEEFLLCLRWILFAERPMTLKEWYFAMMAGVNGRLEWDEGLTNGRMETFLLSSSKGLAELTRGRTITTHFIHESVRDYLIHQGGFAEICGDHDSLHSIAHEQLRHCCFRGMAFDLPISLGEKERNSLSAKYPFAKYATMHILHHADQAATGICQQHFLANEFTIPDWLSRSNAFQEIESKLYVAVPSLSYLCAERNLARLIARPTGPLSLEAQQKCSVPMIAAIMHSSWEVLRLFLNDMNVPNIDETSTEIRSKAKLLPEYSLGPPWRWAVMNGLEHLSRHLLTSVGEEEINESGGHALYTASSGGHEKVVQMLIDAGAHVYAQGRRYSNALYTASLGGYERVVRILLGGGADVNAPGGLCGNALQAASYRGHEKVVQMLIDAGAWVNAPGGDYGHALQAASYHGNDTVVQILLDARADVNDQGRVSGSALREAAMRGHEKVVRLLIDAGADIDAQEEYGGALHTAADHGYRKVVQMLINVGADVNSQGGYSGSALNAAASQGREEVAQMLIDAGADVNAHQKGYFSNALQAASGMGHRKVVHMLLDAGANVRGVFGRYTLQLATERGHETVVQMLKDAEAVEVRVSEESEESN